MTPSDEKALHQFSSSQLGKPFTWGDNDCNTLVIEWVDLLTGSNHIDEVRGQYSNKDEAIEFYRSVKNEEDILAEFHEIDPAFISVGDILTVPFGKMLGAHICVGSRLLSVDRRHGTMLLPCVIPDKAKAWRFN